MGITGSRLRAIIKEEIALHRISLREGVVADTLKTLFNSITSASTQTKPPAAAKQTSKKANTGEKVLIDDSALLTDTDTALEQIGQVGATIGGRAYKAAESQGNRDIVVSYGDVVEGVVSDTEKALATVLRKWGQEAQTRGLSSGVTIVAMTQGILYAVSGKKFEK